MAADSHTSSGWRCLRASPGKRKREQAQTDSKDAIIQKLLDRVDALEREVAALAASAASARATTRPRNRLSRRRNLRPDSAGTPRDASYTERDSNASRFNFRGYADADFQRDVDGTPTKKFEQGEIDLFATERLSPHLNGAAWN